MFDVCVIFSDINYYHCLRIIEILRGTEAASKNLFGRYSSQRMKDWQNIVHLYEKDCVYLGTIATKFVRLHPSFTVYCGIVTERSPLMKHSQFCRASPVVTA